MGETRTIAMTVNGTRYQRETAVRTTLADFLRHELGLTAPDLVHRAWYQNKELAPESRTGG